MIKAVSFLAYLACIPASNVLIAHHGPITVWPGVQAPAGVLVVGVAFTARDILQRVAGRRAAVVAIVLGVALSAVLAGPALALASGAAFLASEFVDMLIFTVLEHRTFTGAVVASNVVGALVDSLIFLSLAFGSLAFLPGQLIGKLLMTALALVIIIPVRLRRAA